MSTGVVRISAGGGFGAEVAGQLAGLLEYAGRTVRVVPEPRADQLAAFVSGADVCVRASWRDILAESDGFATASLGAGRVFLPVAFGHPYVRVGPVVVPGRAPCHACYAARLRQRALPLGGRTAVDDEHERALRENPRLGVTGYPPHLAAMAAGLAVAMLGAADDDRPRIGRVARIDCGTDAVEDWRITPVNGCPVCGPNPEGRAKARRDRLRALARPPVADPSGRAR